MDRKAASRYCAEHGRTMNEIDTVSFRGATPILPVLDFARAMAHYQQQLGFKKKWEWGEPVSFGCVERDDVSIFLSAEDTRGSPRTAIFIDVRDVDALHREYLQNGAIIHEAPTDQPWGSREMVVEDPDGNRIRLATPSER
jgi:predicted enzyme related to lactoylglutathione lyase